MTMSIDRAVIEQALEVLEKHVESFDYEHFTSVCELDPAKDTILILRKALAELDIEEMTLTQIAARHEQAEQEPVAWGRVFDGDIIDCICPEEHALNEGNYSIPLYAAPQPVKQESICCTYPKCNCINPTLCRAQNITSKQVEQKLITEPNVAFAGWDPGFDCAAPVRTKDLTDDEILACGGMDGADDWAFEFARAVISAYKEKNRV